MGGRHDSCRGLALAIALATLLFAARAAAVPVEVFFEGVVDGVEGTVDGNPAAGSRFSGTLRYESEQLFSVSEHPFTRLLTAAYDFPDDSAVLSILLEEVGWGGASSASVTTMRVMVDRVVDPLTGETVGSEVPGGQLAGPIVAQTGGGFGSSENYRVDLEYLRRFPELPDGLEAALRLPDSSAMLASQLAPGASLRIAGPDFSVVGHITTAVPEPSSSALVAGGLLALGARRMRRCRRGVSPPSTSRRRS